MSKQYNIRWTEADAKELARSVKNFNAKVKRLEEKYQGTDVIIPERVGVKELKELIGTRRDLQREVKSLQRFTQRGSEEIVKAPNTEDELFMTRWQRTDMNRRASVINRTRKKRLEQVEELEMRSGGDPLGYTVGEFGMGKAEKLALSPTHAFTPKMSKYDVKQKARSLRKHSQSDYFNKADQRLIDNYTNSLVETYGEEAIKDVLDAIRGMSFNEFYKSFRAEPGAFEFASDIPDDANREAYLNKIRSTWLPEGAR